MSEDKRPYQIYKRPSSYNEKIVPSERYWTLGEVFRECRARGPQWTYRYRYPKNRQRALEELLEERNLPLRVWYRRAHPQGWMVNEKDDPSEEGMSRIGYHYAQAVEFIRKGVLDFFGEDKWKQR